MNIYALENALIQEEMNFRNVLTIPNDVKFGLEIELNHTDFDEVCSKVLRSFGYEYSVKEDISLEVFHNAEIATPVYTNNRNDIASLKKLSKILKTINHNFDGASFQINFDQKLLKNKRDKIRLLKLFAFYEEIIYIFSKGYDPFFRKEIDVYANPITLYLKGMLNKSDQDIIDYFTDKKNYGINFKSKKDLIEIRCPNGTDDAILWENYITFFYYFINNVKQCKINEDVLDLFIDNYSNFNFLEENELDTENALILANSIFNKTQDKVYFMKQYLKR